MNIKYLLLSAVAVLTLTNANAQKKDSNFFNHLSVGVTAGTPGIGVDVAMPVCNYVQLRAGIAVLPKFSFDTDLDINTPQGTGYNIPDNIEVKAKVGGITSGKLLVDIYPFKGSGIHITGGAYFGGSKLATACNAENGILKDLADWNAANPNNKYGAELGDYLLEPDENGNVNASIETASFRPYLGIGFGRAVPRKSRIGFMFELGCQFWGTPKLFCNGHRLTEDEVGGDGGDVIKYLSKATIYPVINFRLCGRIL